MSEKSVRYEVYIPAGMVPAVEEYCDENGVSGSQAFRSLMQKRLEQEGYL